jgi:hypothetical protein
MNRPLSGWNDLKKTIRFFRKALKRRELCKIFREQTAAGKLSVLVSAAVNSNDLSQ